MSKLGWVMALVLVLVVSGTAVGYAQSRNGQADVRLAAAGPVQLAQAQEGGRGQRGGFGQMSEADIAKMREQRQQRMLEEAGLTDKEKAAAKKAMKAKDDARQALRAELMKLQRAANKSKVTDKQLQEAAAAYRASLAQYRKKIAAEDAALVKQLSVKSQVRCLALGILDNGLGGGGRMGMGGGGGGMRGSGGFGGGRPRGG